MYSCYTCGRAYALTEPRWRCECGGFLTLPEQLPFPVKELPNREPNIWRYREAYGLPAGAPTVSLGEGWTPIVEQTIEGTTVRFKLDYLMPSGSFKDRGASVLVSLCKALDIKELVEDSSGNAGAAMAAYCAAAGIRCRIYAPAYTPEGKLIQTRLYGAEVIKVPGTRQDTSEAVLKAASFTYYGSHLWNPFFIQGHMSAAFEIWEQQRQGLPSSIVLPLGSGGYLEGLYRGFRLLSASGLIPTLPRIIGVQSFHCRPFFEGFSLGLETCPPVETQPTLAEGIAVSRPPRGAAVLEGVRRSKGNVLTVSEEEIRVAHHRLLKMGLYVEPTSAVALAGWFKLPKEERENALILLTGHGLKESEKLAKLHGV